jgi:hypothetical protein
VDGDTFHFCDGLKVRLDSIDAPEHGEPFYWESRRALADMLQTKDVKVTDCHYDNHEYIRTAYESTKQVQPIHLDYRMNNKRQAEELLISNLEIPPECLDLLHVV